MKSTLKLHKVGLALLAMMTTGASLMAQTSAKITELPAASSLAATDLVLTVTDPGGTPVTKSATLAVLFDLLDNATLTLTNKTISGSSNTITGVPQSGVSNLVSDLAAKQPLDADLTSIAALTTTSYGLDLLTLADAAALRTAGGLVIGSDIQGHDGKLDTIVGGGASGTYVGVNSGGDFGYHAFPATRVNVQTFTSNGTWTKPAGALSVHIEMYGGGGGGGSGTQGPAASNRSGGGGGGAGCKVVDWIDPSELLNNESVVVGAGGAGGVSQTVSSSGGVNGEPGGASTFAGRTASGGNFGFGPTGAGSTTATAGAAVSSGCFVYDASSNGGAGGTGTVAAGQTPTVVGTRSPTGGGGGGGISISDTASNGGAGGAQGAAPVGSIAGGSGGGGGSSGGVDGTGHRGGGGGGGGGFAGGGGSFGGGGGGGGGASANGTPSGAGGNGGDGYVIITTYLTP